MASLILAGNYPTYIKVTFFGSDALLNAETGEVILDTPQDDEYVIVSMAAVERRQRQIGKVELAENLLEGYDFSGVDCLGDADTSTLHRIEAELQSIACNL